MAAFDRNHTVLKRRCGAGGVPCQAGQPAVSELNFSTLSKLDSKTLSTKAELLQLNRTQFPSLGIFGSKKVGN